MPGDVFATASAKRAKERPHILDQTVRVLHGEKMPTLVELGPPHHVVIALGQTTNGDVLRQGNGDAGRDRAALPWRERARVVIRLVIEDGRRPGKRFATAGSGSGMS